ncbi:MAG: peptidylprolyl isomerase [Magnetococcales bacterium]|nr:peptidylprolyl isomerase [Magnetococcales bacterium]
MDIATNSNKIGRLIFKLYHNTTPRTVTNFAKLIKGDEGFGYRDSIFHRIIPNFMAQGGDFERGDGTGGYSIYGKTFEDENFKLNHDKRGQLSMANSGQHTNGSQFFILFRDTPHLNGKHVVFGEMIDGWDTLDYIEQMGTESGTPRETIKISDCNLISN